ncbi:MAG TPA: DNA repair protein RadA, partial [Thermoanaerobaculia bacterium]|nr:DNA repair protein RadA [Thermoanaerobaculia bacterium]
MAKKAAVFSCTECGSQSPKWLGRCPDCNAWNSFAQEDAPRATGGPSAAAPAPISAIDTDATPRLSTNIPALDRVLGGGLVAGAVTLVGGEPGIGKSTLLLQAAQELAQFGRVLYVSGEESPRQIALRGRRLGTTNENILLFGETSIERIIAEIEKLHPVAAIIDSIQTVHTAVNDSTPGAVGQVRDSAGTLMTAAKRLSVPIFLIGHITKEGTIAGPKSLEHIVDTVLYFEGDKFQNYRVVRAYKNRFGPANEMAIFEMHDDGLEEVANPSAALLSQRSSAPGSAVVAALEGTRPLLIEVQALVSATHFPSPRRTAMGIDANRVSLLLAVLERKSGGNFSMSDIYVNLAGGLQIDEPAIDLGIVAAVFS